MFTCASAAIVTFTRILIHDAMDSRINKKLNPFTAWTTTIKSSHWQDFYYYNWHLQSQHAVPTLVAVTTTNAIFNYLRLNAVHVWWMLVFLVLYSTQHSIL